MISNSSTSKNKEITYSRLHWIEWVRGVAALMVMLHHFGEQVSPDYLFFSRHYVDLGRSGVVAFFLVSGFVVPLSLQNQQISVFLVRRVTRLFPLYWFVLILTILFLKQDDWSAPYWWLEVALNTTMLQEFFGHSIIGVAWTLAIEWVFYFQLVIAKKIGLLNQIWKMAFLWTALFAFSIHIESQFGSSLPISVFALLGIAGIGQAFSLWILGKIPSKVLFLSILTTLLTLLVSVLFRSQVDPLWPGYLYATSSTCGLIIFAIAYIFRDRFKLSVLVSLGALSYSIYLLQTLFIPIFGITENQTLLYIIGTVAALLVVGFSKITFRFIESPCISFGRRYRNARANPKSQ